MELDDLFIKEITYPSKEDTNTNKPQYPKYKFVIYDKETNTETEIAQFIEKTTKKIFSIMNIELKGKPNTNNYYVVTEFNDYTRYKNGNYEFRLYNIK